MSPAEQRRLRQRVAEERQRAVAQVTALERSFDDIVEASADAVRDDEHDPEGQTIAFERAQLATLLADARAKVLALEAAAARLDGPDPGRCTECGREIAVARLLARPSTAHCVSCAAGSSSSRRRPTGQAG